MEVICRFCLKTIEKPLQIDKMVKEITEILMLKLDLRITPESVMCYECAETLQTGFDFKSACMYTEDCLYPFIEGKSEPRLDLWEVYLKINDSKDVESVKGREVCRFCMKPSDSDCCTPVDVIEENVEIKKLLENYLPEVVMGVIEKPVACKNCCNFLHQYSLFVTSFLHVEQQIQSYFKTLGRDYFGEIDLRQVRDFSLSSVTKREAETNGKDKVAKEVVMIFSEIENEEKIVPEEDMECAEKETGESKISMASPDFYGFAESDELFTWNEIPVIEDAQVDVEMKRPFLEPLGTEVTEKYLEEDVIHTEETKGESLKSQRVPSPQKIEECQELEASLGIKLVEFEIKKEDDECDGNENSTLSLIDPSMIFSGDADIKPAVADTSYNPEANHTAIESGPDQNSSKTDTVDSKEVKSVGDVEGTVYRCKICPYKAKRKHHLNDHKLVHKDISEVTAHQCKLCPYKTKRKGDLVKHMLSHKDPSERPTYDCNLCSYTTKIKQCLSKHMTIHKANPKVPVPIPGLVEDVKKTIHHCKLCPYKNKFKSNLTRHMLIHKDISEVKVHRCKLCPYKTKRKADLTSHMLIHKDPSEVTTYDCNFCSYKTNRKQSLTIHKRIHEDNPKVKSVEEVQETVYHCKLCPYKNKLKYNLTRHMLVHKDISEVKVYQCKLCAYNTKRKGDLVKHMPSHMDPSERPTYHCNFCSYKAKYKSSLIKHLLIHKDNPKVKSVGEVQEAVYRCKLCPYKARLKKYLTRHMLVHMDISKVTAYQCGLCRFKTKRKDDLVKHIKQTHKDSSEEASELERNLQIKSQVGVVEEAIYNCKLCPYETKFKECLDEHTLTHEDNSKHAHGTETEKETIIHRCKLCPYKTKRKSDLTKHMLIHKDPSEITTYDCKFCSYKAKQKGNLKRHTLTHKDNPKDASELETNLQVKSQVEVVGEAIYRCKICPYETKFKECLDEHTLTHEDNSKNAHGTETEKLVEGVKETIHSCKLCHYKTKWKGDLVKHMLVHKDSSEVRPYDCNRCSYKAKRKGDLNKHMRTHKDKPKIVRPPVKLVANKHIYKCKHCPYKTQRKNNFNDHMLVHKDISEVKSYHCLLCPYKSKRKCDLAKHMMSHRDPSERPTYHCYFCSYKAKRKSLLIKHLLIHKDNPKVKSVGKVQETIYRCKLCTHKTKLKDNLTKHMLVHKDISEVKLHRCKVCPYKTKRKCNLSQHMLGHKYISKVTTYHCNFCSHEAKCKSSLIKHLLIHKDNPKDAKSTLTQQRSMSGKYELEECSTIKSEEVDIKDEEDECDDATNKL